MKRFFTDFRIYTENTQLSYEPTEEMLQEFRGVFPKFELAAFGWVIETDGTEAEVGRQLRVVIQACEKPDNLIWYSPIDLAGNWSSWAAGQLAFALQHLT